MRLKASTVYILETGTSQSEGFVSYFSSTNENRSQEQTEEEQNLHGEHLFPEQ